MQTVLLPATHPTQVNAPSSTPAGQASSRFIYPGGIESGVDLGHWLYSEMQTPTTNAYASFIPPTLYGESSEGFNLFITHFLQLKHWQPLLGSYLPTYSLTYLFGCLLTYLITYLVA